MSIPEGWASFALLASCEQAKTDGYSYLMISVPDDEGPGEWCARGSSDDIRFKHLQMEGALKKSILAIFYLKGNIQEQMKSPESFHYGDISVSGKNAQEAVSLALGILVSLGSRQIGDVARSLGES